MHPLSRWLSAATALAASAFAQQSFIVDVTGGPGANFTSISAAVAAVPDGSILRVRTGQYLESVAVIGKGLTITGEPGAAIFGPLQAPGLLVAGLAAGQAFVMRGMQIRSSLSTAAIEVRVENTHGLVMLDGFDDLAPRKLTANDCEALLVSRCRFSAQGAYGVTLDHCQAVLDECTVTELGQIGGSLQLCGSTVVGTAGLLQPGGDAIDMQGGELRLLGGQVSGGFSLSTIGQAFTGFGAVRLSSDTTVQGTSAPGIVAVTSDMPHVATTWVTGSIYSTYVTGAAGDVAFLLVALRSLPQQVPGLDAIWLDGPTAQVVASGVLGSGTLATITVLPNSTAFSGQSLLWQALNFAPNGSFAISNPSWRIVP